MDCVESIELLSEYHAGALDERLRREVHLHLVDCPPCHDVMSDLELIISLAATLEQCADTIYPDEDAVWIRLKIAKGTVY